MKSPSRNSPLAMRTDIVENYWGSDAISHLETVSIQTIDDFPRQGIDLVKRSAYLKLDTQGFDLEFAKGATSSLKNILALQTEASIRPT